MPFAVDVAAVTSRGVAGAGMAAGSAAAPELVAPDPVDTPRLTAGGAEAAPRPRSLRRRLGDENRRRDRHTDSRAAAAT